MSDIVLHHFPASPYAEKIRAILGFKKLMWKSVTIPAVMPKPDVVALTGGYRRTPVLQIGADVYCDSGLIARAIEDYAPSPTLFTYGDTLAMEAITFLSEAVLFNTAVPIAFTPASVKVFFPDATPEFLDSFRTDRQAPARLSRLATMSAARRCCTSCRKSSRSFRTAGRSCSAQRPASRTSACTTRFGRCGVHPA